MIFCGVPVPTTINLQSLEHDYLVECNYNREELNLMLQNNRPLLNDEQKNIFNCVTREIETGKGKTFFIDASGGTGKTFLINLLLVEVRRLGGIALAVASSGIAANLLNEGRTAHSSFKTPIDVANREHSLCYIDKQSGRGHLLRMCKLIIWDEANLIHKKAIEALDRNLKDIRDKSIIIGGCTVVFSGDFWQILPVVPMGTKTDAVSSCLKSSTLWTHVDRLTLSQNMHVLFHANSSAKVFTQNLLHVRDGSICNDENGLIQLLFGTFVSSVNDLVGHVFPNIRKNYFNIQWLSERAILAAKNTTVSDINTMLLALIPGESRSCLSVDTMCDSKKIVNFPIQFLNSLNPSKIPPQNLLLKIDAPIILLRNIDPPKLCNGTRLVVRQMMQHVLEATIITGRYAGENVFILRLPIKPSNHPVKFNRLQFSICFAYGMTVNKSQGQALSVTGL